MALDMNGVISKIVICVYVVEINKDNQCEKKNKLHIQNLLWKGHSHSHCHLYLARSQRWTGREIALHRKKSKKK